MKGTCDIWLKAKVAAVFQGEEKERERGGKNEKYSFEARNHSP